jgi:Spy/CpxP family protein refolding chaperone
MDRARLKGYGALLLVFVLGLLIGGAGSRAMLQRRYAHLFRDRFSVFEHRRLGALSHRLDLDDAQEDKVRAIMAKYGQERRQLAHDMLDRCGEPLRAQKAQMDAEIRALLRPDQQNRYDALIKDSNSHSPTNGPLEPLP